MKILITGATGYIGQRLIPFLLDKGYNLVCCVRDKQRFESIKYNTNNLQVIEADFLRRDTLEYIPKDIDVAYYLIHSMATNVKNFDELEKTSAENFRDVISATDAKQVIYLSGIVNENKLSKHLMSRKNVELIISKGKYALTTLRAGIIIGSGSASFEIIRDLVEKLPIMIAPKWLNTLSQPIAIKNVIEYLIGVLGNSKTFGKSFDIGGPDILTYKQMLLKYAEVRGLKRKIIIVPVLTPRLSSYWLYFVTSTSYSLAKNLVDSMKVEIICRNNDIRDIINIKLINYETALKLAFDTIEHYEVISSWKDALTSNLLTDGISQHINVPVKGCLRETVKRRINDERSVLDKIWKIGGDTGWYYANFLWSIRGFIDKLIGGVGLRRGRKNPIEISTGECLDFWRVLFASKKEKRLLLYAEMKLPGEAWLEFKIENEFLIQTATFRPKGLAGRIYWYLLLPIHKLIFKGMAKRISEI
ncbi:MAG: SDR family oxidoreductase [Ignavibacteria bacterium]|nr:SDR family oxidoreductase [Ignavibacteria bacterium]